MRSYHLALSLSLVGALVFVASARVSSQNLTLNPVELHANKQTVPASQQEFVAKIDQIAQQITVSIDSNNSGNGSGAIVAKQGNTYYVLTAAHVVKNPDRYTLTAPDDRQYQLDSSQIAIFEEVDLAVVQFTAKQTYSVATLAKYSRQDSFWVFVSGFPKSLQGGQLQRLLTAGLIQTEYAADFLTKDGYSLSQGGYELVYTNLSYRGMSGGPVLDSRGYVIGINTAAENELQITERGEVAEIGLGYSLGVPIDTFIGLRDRTKIDVNSLRIETTAPPLLTDAEIESVEANLLNVKVPDANASDLDWLNYGNQLWRLERYEEADSAFDRAISLKKDFYQAHYGKGLALYGEERYQDAIAAFVTATEIDPSFAPAWRYQGKIMMELNNYPKALAAYDRAVKLNPEDFVLHVERGNILRALERYNDALAAYSQAIELKAHPSVYNNRGLAYTEIKDYQNAIADFDRVISQSPNDSLAYIFRGDVYANLGDYQKAIADFNKAIDLDPNDSLAYIFRGNTHRSLNQYREALADYDKAIAIVPDDAYAYTTRGNVYTDLKRYREALADYDKAIALDPDDAYSYTIRGNIYIELEQYQKALSDYDKAIATDPNYVYAYTSRGDVYIDLERYQEALADYDKAIALDPDDVYSYTIRGNIYMDLERYQEALADYDKAIATDPNYAYAYTSRGYVYIQLKEKQKAIADLEKAAQLYCQEESSSSACQEARESLRQLQESED